MVNYCCAFGCRSKFEKGGPVTLHSFPKDEGRRKLWESKICRADFKATDYSKVCSKHFAEDCFEKGKFGGTWLTPDAVPTKFNFPAHFVPKRKTFSPPKKWVVIEAAQHVGSVSNLEGECDPVPVSSSCDIPALPEIHTELSVSTASLDDNATPATEKRHWYLGDFTEEDMNSPSKAQKVLRIARKQIESHLKEIKNLRQKKIRLEKRVASLNAKINALKRKQLISESDQKILLNMS